MRITAALFIMLILALSAIPAKAGSVCVTEVHTGSLAWVYSYGDSIYHVYREPTLGNDIQDCLEDPFTCETIRCEVNNTSEYECKDSQAPVSHCVNYTIAQCTVDDELEMPFILEVDLCHTGPCESETPVCNP